MKAAHFRHLMRSYCGVGLWALCLLGVALPTNFQVSRSLDETTESEGDGSPCDPEEMASLLADPLVPRRQRFENGAVSAAAVPCPRQQPATTGRLSATSLLESHNGCGATLRC